jgi:hypothetical protein
LRLDSTQPLSGPLLSFFPISTGRPFELIGELVTTAGSPVALVGEAVSLICNPLALVRKLLARVGRLLAFVHQPFALILDPRVYPRVSVPPSGMTLVAQPGSLPLQVYIIGSELRRPTLDL